MKIFGAVTEIHTRTALFERFIRCAFSFLLTLTRVKTSKLMYIGSVIALGYKQDVLEKVMYEIFYYKVTPITNSQLDCSYCMLRDFFDDCEIVLMIILLEKSRLISVFRCRKSNTFKHVIFL